MKIRGYLALAAVALGFPVFDLVQRTAIWASSRLMPARRVAVMGWWINRMRAFVVWCLVRIGGASIPMPDRVVPSGPGTLIVMNHQSVLDIPLAVGAVKDGYPRIVTRARYSRFIPLISHMVRLYQYPVVDPKAKSHKLRKSLSTLAEAAVTSDVPIAIFPEGTRTQDGEVGRFKTRGLQSLLSEREWTVHLFVVDGYWQSAKLKHFVRGMAHVKGQVRYLGELQWTDPEAPIQPFVDEMRTRIVDGLAELRADTEAELRADTEAPGGHQSAAPGGYGGRAPRAARVGHGMTGESRWPEARELAERLVGDTGTSVRAVLLYGSRLLRTHPDRHSALDFVVIVDDYRAFYRGLAAAGQLQRPVGVMTGLSRVLPPNVIAYTPDDGRNGLAKCLVVNRSDFARALGPNPPDHFILGRMLQLVGEVWTADPSEGAWVREQITGAHLRVLRWMAPYLDAPVDAAGLGRRILEVCYQGELRPESRGRAGAIFEAQAEHFAEVLDPALRAAAEEGTMIERDGLYRFTEPVPHGVVRRWRRHFRRSKIRSTSRWLKHTITFSNWLPYVARKVERHTGRTIELTTLERKLPLIFLWPRVIHVLLTRPRREIRS